MAFASTTIWEVNQAGASGNGGGFDPANANMSTNLAATNANTASPVVTSATYNFITRDNNNYLFVPSGTNWIPGWYRIASTAGNAATLDASIGAVLLYNGATIWNTVAGCASVASPTGGKWSVDYSRGTAAGIAYTDMVIGGTNTQYTSVANPVGPNVIGNVVSVNSGSGFTVQRIQVASVTGTTATADKAIGTAASTGGNGNLGGAVDHPATIGGVVISGNIAFDKYSATAHLFGATANVSGGRVNPNFAGDLVYQGYDTTRALDNNDANRPIWRINANSVTAFTAGAGPYRMCGIVVDNPSAFTGAQAFSTSTTSALVSRVKASGMTGAGFVNTGTGTRFVDCEDVGSNSSSARFSLGPGGALRCVVQGAVGSGVAFSSSSIGAWCEGCAVINHPANAFSFGSVSTNALLRHCVAYGTTGAGFTVAADSDCEWCISYGNSTYGFSSATSASIAARLRNCAGGANGTANYQSTFRSDLVTNFKALSGNPFNNPGSLDFGVNSATGAGAAGRALSATLAGLATTTYEDVGAAQHADGSVASMAPVQFSPMATGTTATPTATLPAASTAGNFLFMMVLANSGTIVVPSGWSTAYNGTLGNPCAIFYKENNAGGITSITAGLPGTGRWLAVAGEVVGPATTGSLDQVATASGGSSPSYPSGTITTTSADEFILALIGEGSSDTFSAPTGGFEFKVQGSGGATVAMALLWRTASAIGTFATTLTGGGANPNSGIIASFKAPAGGGGGGGGAAGIIVNPGMGDFQ